MKSKYHIPLAILGIPLLLSNPTAHAQDNHKDKEVIAVEVLETSKKRAKEARQKWKQSAKRAKERGEDARERGQEAIENANERAKDERKNQPQSADKARDRDLKAREDGENAAEKAKEDAIEARGSGQDIADKAKDREKDNRKQKQAAAENANERAEERAEIARERVEKNTGNAKDRAKDRIKEARKNTEDSAKNANKQANKRAKDARKREEKTADNTNKPSKNRADETRERDKKSAENAKKRTEKRTEKSAKRAIVDVPASEPERRAEKEVAEITRDVQVDLEKRKTRIDGRDQAQALIKDILGAESRISRAEIAREERFKPRFERERQGENRRIDSTPDQRRAATNYYQERLHGRQVDGPAPEFFRRPDRRYEGRDSRIDGRDDRRMDYARPRYLNEGRRYVHYDSRSSIPAILMAAQVLNYVRFQPTQEIAPIFYDRQNVNTSYAMPLPPENYRSADSVVVSYPVDENSMISSEDILFLQGSTQFSDPYSYEVISIMADAMKAMPEDERFVIEGHASAEGSYEDNMILSQHRAEHIVREIVRRGGISPDRLIPVGYGESEARLPADAAESLRRQDRRVVVFRMKPEAITQR